MWKGHIPDWPMAKGSCSPKQASYAPQSNKPLTQTISYKLLNLRKKIYVKLFLICANLAFIRGQESCRNAGRTGCITDLGMRAVAAEVRSSLRPLLPLRANPGKAAIRRPANSVVLWLLS